MLRWLPSSVEHSRRWFLSLWPLAVAVGALAEWSLFGSAGSSDWVPDLLTGWVLIGCGLVGCSRRPDSGSGALLVATGFAWFAPNFATTGLSALDWLSAHALYLHRGPLVALVLTYPRGRPVRWIEKVAIAVGYALAVITPVWRNYAATVVLAAALTLIGILDYRGTAGGERRMRHAALQATTAIAAVFLATAVLRLAVHGRAATEATLHGYQAALCAVSIGLMIGLLRAPWERAEVADLVVELGETPTATLRGALARALSDPSLQVGFWAAGAGGFIDAEGQSIEPPDVSSARSLTTIERDGQPVAILVHDPAVLEDPGLVDAVDTAAKLAAANARLYDEVRVRLAEIRVSRQRIVEAGDEERRRLEGRLRRGPQRLLDELAATLREARRSAICASTADRVAQSVQQLCRAQEELARLGRGIHPRELSERGLSAALATLANDLSLPVELSVSEIGASLSVLTCVYFSCSEALVNVKKYAAASNVRVLVSSDQEKIIVEVADNGAGGADPGRGTGLRGLGDRLETLGGTLTVNSPPGGGTRLTATIPRGARPPT